MSVVSPCAAFGGVIVTTVGSIPGYAAAVGTDAALNLRGS
jgi:hypothetical protein